MGYFENNSLLEGAYETFRDVSYNYWPNELMSDLLHQ